MAPGKLLLGSEAFEKHRVHAWQCLVPVPRFLQTCLPSSPQPPQEQERALRAGSGTQPSLLRAIVAAYGRPYFWLGLLKLAGDALNFAGPLLLNLLLRHLAAAPAQHTNSPSFSDANRSGSSGGGSSILSLLGWHADVAEPGFGYACAAALAGSLVLKVGWHAGHGLSLVFARNAHGLKCCCRLRMFAFAC